LSTLPPSRLPSTPPSKLTLPGKPTQPGKKILPGKPILHGLLIPSLLLKPGGGESILINWTFNQSIIFIFHY
jgi:hypothetical protein